MPAVLRAELASRVPTRYRAMFLVLAAIASHRRLGCGDDPADGLE